jgi:hypothetical protein
MLVVGVSALPQGPVVDIAATSEGLRQEAFLFITWVEAILVGFLLWVYELVVGKQGKKEYPHLDKKTH